jgi:hypothetical protein
MTMTMIAHIGKPLERGAAGALLGGGGLGAGVTGALLGGGLGAGAAGALLGGGLGAGAAGALETVAAAV